MLFRVAQLRTRGPRRAPHGGERSRKGSGRSFRRRRKRRGADFAATRRRGRISRHEGVLQSEVSSSRSIAQSRPNGRLCCSFSQSHAVRRRRCRDFPTDARWLRSLRNTSHLTAYRPPGSPGFAAEHVRRHQIPGSDKIPVRSAYNHLGVSIAYFSNIRKCVYAAAEKPIPYRRGERYGSQGRRDRQICSSLQPAGDQIE